MPLFIYYINLILVVTCRVVLGVPGETGNALRHVLSCVPSAALLPVGATILSILSSARGLQLALVVSGPVASPLGATILSTLSSARGLQLAAVVDGNPEANGRDAGEVAGLPEPLELPVVADVIMVLASVAQVPLCFSGASLFLRCLAVAHLPLCCSVFLYPCSPLDFLSPDFSSLHSPSTHSASTHSPSTHSPSTHSPSTHSPSTHSPSTHSPSTHSPSTHSPSTHSPSTHSPSTHSPSTHSPSNHSPSTHSPSTHSPSTHSSSTHSLHSLPLISPSRVPPFFPPFPHHGLSSVMVGACIPILSPLPPPSLPSVSLPSSPFPPHQATAFGLSSVVVGAGGHTRGWAATAFGLSSVVVGAHIPEDELSGLYEFCDKASMGCIIAPTLSILSILLERAATQFAFHCSHAHIIESRAGLAQRTLFDWPSSSLKWDARSMATMHLTT
ncbi:unnamed protein product, partial [Closterium sp. Naga37s-1]